MNYVHESFHEKFWESVPSILDIYEIYFRHRFSCKVIEPKFQNLGLSYFKKLYGNYV